jgi:hemoglobin-like flavoprotein
MNILFVYYVSSFYYQQNKSLSIIHHIYDVIKNNIKVRYIFNMNKDFFVSQFKYIDKDIENIDKDIDKDENIDKNIENKNIENKNIEN